MNTVNPDWLGTGNHCLWTGVTCNDDFQVVSFSLDNLGLTGPYPTTLGNLSEMTSLSTLGNGLTGDIPNDVCSKEAAIVGDETNCPNAFGTSGCCDEIRLTSPSPYLDAIVVSRLGSSDCSSIADYNSDVCTFMRNKANHDVFDADQYPSGFPYETWLEVRFIIICRFVQDITVAI